MSAFDIMFFTLMILFIFSGTLALGKIAHEKKRGNGDKGSVNAH
jgi:hypothetical protein